MATPSTPPTRAFHRLKQAHRRALHVSELTDAEVAAIEAAEVPAEHRYSLEDLE